MITIEFVHSDQCLLQKAEDWLAEQGYIVERGWTVSDKRGKATCIIKYEDGSVNAYVNCGGLHSPYYTLDGFKYAIMADKKQKTTNMKKISFVSQNRDLLQEAQNWLIGKGFPVRNGGHVSTRKAQPMRIDRGDNGEVFCHNHMDGIDYAYHNLHDFKNAILDDMKTTQTKMDYKDICIKFDTTDQAQAFAEMVHRNGHPIKYWESDCGGHIIGWHENEGFHRDGDRFRNIDKMKHISDAPLEWLRFLHRRVVLIVAGQEVEITADGAKIGCTKLTREEVKMIYKSMYEG